MISKQALENIISRQRKEVEEFSAGFQREILSELPYLTDKAMLIGGVRGSGCSYVLRYLLHNEYLNAWFTDMEDPRLSGFDSNDFLKLSSLIIDSGRGVLLIDRIDLAPGWEDFISDMVARGIKVIVTTDLATMMRLESEQGGKYIIHRVGLLSFGEFAGALRKRQADNILNEYMAKGGFPGNLKSIQTPKQLRKLYANIINTDVLLKEGIRDKATLQRIALKLIDSCGEFVSANSLRNTMKVKAVSTVNEHFDLLAKAGLFSFIPIFSDSVARQAVNPRKVYPVDTAMAAAVTSLQSIDRNKLLECIVYNYLAVRYGAVSYTAGNGGCDFVITDEHGQNICIQTCYDIEDIDLLQDKIDGLTWAIGETGAERGLLVVPDEIPVAPEDHRIEIMDAEMFLGGETNI